MKYALRTDRNQGEIVKALEKAGCTVWIIGKPVDLLVGVAGVNYLLEVKDGDKPPSGRKLTKAQRDFKDWGGSWSVVNNIDEALEAVGLRPSYDDLPF